MAGQRPKYSIFAMCIGNIISASLLFSTLIFISDFFLDRQ